MPKQTLELLDETFRIHSLSPSQSVPPEVFESQIYFLGKTYDELSIVCPEDVRIDSVESEGGWSALEVLGPLGFSLTGILSNISGVLAQKKISIFAISTFDTDYILVKKETILESVKALRDEGYTVVGD